MRKNQLKNFLNLRVLLIGISFLFYTCQEPNILEQVSVQENIDTSYRIISLDEAPEIKNIIENMQSEINDANILRRETATVYGVAKVDIEKIIAITKNGATNYTFGIDTDFKNTGYIENLQLIAVEEGYIAYIMRYEPEEGWKDDDFNKTPKGDLVLDILNFTGHKTKYALDGTLIWTTDYSETTVANRLACSNVSIKYCHNDGVGGYNPIPHVAGANCTGYLGQFIYDNVLVCQEVAGPSGGGGNGTPSVDCEDVLGSMIIDSEVLSGVISGCAFSTISGIKQISKKSKNCIELERDTSNQDVKDNFAILKANTNGTNEKGFSILQTTLDNPYLYPDPITEGNENFWDSGEANYLKKATAHNHIEGKHIEVFSPSDIIGLIDILSVMLAYPNETTNSIEDLSSYLVTEQGYYAIKFSDPSKTWNNFGLKYASNSPNYDSKFKREIDKFYKRNKIKKGKPKNDQIVGFLNLLETYDLGLEMYETDSTLENWKLLTLDDNNDIKRTPCN